MDALAPHIDAARLIRDAEVVSDWDMRASELGRSWAAQNVRTNPEVRKLMEDTYGKPFCQQRYPEAYAKS